jgi:PAS domain S-box-containing protein
MTSTCATSPSPSINTRKFARSWPPASRSSFATPAPIVCSTSCEKGCPLRASLRSVSFPSSSRASRWACSSCALVTWWPSASTSSPCIAPSPAPPPSQQITFARFEAERRLKTLQRYVDFFDSAADGIAVIDSEGKLLFSNPRARQITGYGEADLKGKTFDDLCAAHDRARAEELRLGFQKGVYPEGFDIDVKRSNGAVVRLSVNTSSVLREENAILLTFRDVTQERATEAELKQTKEFLERVIDNSVDAIVAADMKGRVLLFNRAAQRCYGYLAEEVVGRLNVAELYPPGIAREVMRLIKSGLFGGPGRLEDYHCDMLGKGGERIPVSLSAALIYDGARAVASVGLFTDLRERLQMQERLAAAQQELRSREKQAIIAELAGAAAHELNQPLTSVMGFAELLKRRLDRDTPAYAAAHVIVNEAERMAEIVRKIGKITKYETKSYVGAAKIVDIDKASEETEPAEAESPRRE